MVGRTSVEDTLPHRSVTHVGKLYCHLCLDVQQLIRFIKAS